jgi:ABC-type uncharacterized transport system permease subunit
MPSISQLTLLFVAATLFVASAGSSLVGRWRGGKRMSVLARVLLGAGIAGCVGLIVWHDASRGQWLPIGDNFDALLWLATLLAIFVLYVQVTRPVVGLDWFITPVVVVLLLAAALVGKTEYHSYVGSAWDWMHRVTAYGGAVAFAIAAATGAMYVVNSRRLRAKSPAAQSFASLERLEHLTMSAVVLGFALLTFGAITGGVTMLAEGRHTSSAKIALTVAVWLVYAIVLHAPINPSFRGRKVAVLSVVGFVLMIGTLAAVVLLPGGVR